MILTDKGYLRLNKKLKAIEEVESTENKTDSLLFPIGKEAKHIRLLLFYDWYKQSC